MTKKSIFVKILLKFRDFELFLSQSSLGGGQNMIKRLYDMEPGKWAMAIILLGTIFMGIYTCRGALIDERSVLLLAQTQGYTQIRIKHAQKFFAQLDPDCAQETTAGSFKAKAINKKDQTVNIVICCDWPFGSCTLFEK